jgi:hypothetical protein
MATVMKFIGHRPITDQRRANRRADDRLLGDRRRTNTVGAVLARKPLGSGKHAAALIVGNVLAHQDDARVQRHGFIHREVDRLREIDPFRFGRGAHAAISCSNTSRPISTVSG